MGYGFPKGQTNLELTLVVANSEEKRRAVGKQAGDNVFLTLETDDCRKEYKALKAKSVEFYWKPEIQVWGVYVVLRTSTATCSIWFNASSIRIEIFNAIGSQLCGVT